MTFQRTICGIVYFFLVVTSVHAEIPPWARVFDPLPDKLLDSSQPLESEKIDLGRTLYFETRFSSNGKISCNSCHQIDNYGVDGEPTSPGHAGKRGNRNSPTVFNAAVHVAQFWDGRAKTVEEQALGPVLNPIEMGMSDASAVLAVINGDPALKERFRMAFPNDKEPVTFENFGKAIGAYERTLLTPARFDSFLKGESNALSDAEKQGGEMFVNLGCAACHSGVGIGGGMFQKIGLVVPYETKDLGKFETTRVESDKHVFKVPSLRNIDRTGPYFHDGSVKDLREAVRLMGSHQLGRKLEDSTVESLVTFLGSLTSTSLPK